MQKIVKFNGFVYEFSDSIEDGSSTLSVIEFNNRHISERTVVIPNESLLSFIDDNGKYERCLLIDFIKKEFNF